MRNVLSGNNVLKTPWDQQADRIRAYERSLVKQVSSSVVKPKPISVWEVVIPVLLIFNHVAFKQKRELFTLNMIFTKHLAIDAALDMVKYNRLKQDALADVETQTKIVLASDTQGVYSESIRQCQHREIEFLIDHYRMLFCTGKMEYNEMVIHAYPVIKAYMDFVHRLKILEKDVTDAAKQILGSRADIHMLAKIESSLENIRITNTQKIYHREENQ